MNRWCAYHQDSRPADTKAGGEQPLPAGVAGGRWAWRLLAAQLGVLPEPSVPFTAIFIAIPAALVAANLIAAAPGQAAARTPIATVLRAE